MQVTIQFDPRTDLQEDVHTVVEAVFGADISSAAGVHFTAHGTTGNTYEGSVGTGQTFDEQHEGLMGGNAAAAFGAGGNAPANLAPGADPSQQQQTNTATGAGATSPNANVNSAPTSTGSGAAVQLDARGLPWDKRIHSDAKDRLTTKGVWKMKRGVADSLVKTVEAELLAALAAGGGAPVASTDGGHQLPQGGILGAVDPSANLTGAGGQPPANLAPQNLAPQGQAPANLAPQNLAPQPTNQPPHDFASLMAWAAPLMQSPGNPTGALTAHILQVSAYRSGLAASTGVGDVKLVEHRPDLAAKVWEWAVYLMNNPTQIPQA